MRCKYLMGFPGILYDGCEVTIIDNNVCFRQDKETWYMNIMKIGKEELAVVNEQYSKR